MGDQEAHRASVLGRERLTAVCQGEQVPGAVEVAEREVGGVVLFGVDQDVARVRTRPRALEHGLDRHSAERVVEPAPAGHAVDVADRLATRHRQELGPRKRQRVLHEARHFETPGREVHGGDTAVVQDGPLAGHDLTGRESVGAGGADVDGRRGRNGTHQRCNALVAGGSGDISR